MSVAKNLMAGRILEEQLFPYPAMSKIFASEALQRSAYEALREAAGIYERYTLELAKAADDLLRKHGKSIADRQHDLKRVADIGIDSACLRSAGEAADGEHCAANHAQ
jgi:hypothetical protein